MGIRTSPEIVKFAECLFIRLTSGLGKKSPNPLRSSDLRPNGRDGEIRTLDLLLPKQALYQAKLRPDFYPGLTGKERSRDPKGRGVANKIFRRRNFLSPEGKARPKTAQVTL